MERILVTGGAGYIGSQTAKAIAGSGFEPVVLDNFSAGHRWAVKWGPLVEGDLSDGDLILGALKDHKISSVIHFAAHAYVGESMADPGKYFRNNVANTLNLLDAMREAEVKHIVFSSTCATYGMPGELPLRESHPQAPVNPYGESKLFVERILKWYGRAYGMGWMALRYFNAAGADPGGEIGELHDPETHLIPLAQAAILGRQELRILGTDFPTPDGTAIRDYIHVLDLADAHLRALQHLRDGGESMALNLGTGQGHSVREVVRMVEEVAGKPPKTREAPRRPGDPPELIADPTLAAKILGWRPRHSNLRTIIESAWRWEQSRS